MIRPVRLSLVGLALLNASLLLAAGSASAEITGPCSGSFGGQDAAGLSSTSAADAVPVSEEGEVAWSFTSTGGAEIVSWTVDLFYGPFSAQVASGSDPEPDEEPDTTKGDIASVADYAWMGVGLYKVSATVGLHGGGACTGTVLVNVEGNPLTTVVGGGAAVIAVGGAVGMGAAGMSALNAAGFLPKP